MNDKYTQELKERKAKIDAASQTDNADAYPQAQADLVRHAEKILTAIHNNTHQILEAKRGLEEALRIYNAQRAEEDARILRLTNTQTELKEYYDGLMELIAQPTKFNKPKKKA